MVKDSSFHPPQDPEKKYQDIGYLKKMFTQRDQDELLKIRKIHNLTDEQVELFCDFAKLRDSVLEDMKLEFTKRQKTNPRASERELDMGAYLEQIEPQVRTAVMTLRHKGYTTKDSGFTGYDSQRIKFEDEHLKDFAMPEDLKDELMKAGAELIIEPNLVKIKFTRFNDLEKIEELWQKVVAELPPLGGIARPCEIKSAHFFRDKQKKVT